LKIAKTKIDIRNQTLGPMKLLLRSTNSWIRIGKKKKKATNNISK
jgi:hypothetical protein